MRPRASWDETWMAVADAVARRSECSRAQVGAVVTLAENRIVATGYNGAPAGYQPGIVFDKHDFTCLGDCRRAIDGPTDPRSYTDCPSIHAEANAIAFCDRRDREGGTIYVSSNCCWECAKLVANSGLSRVVFRVDAGYRMVDEVRRLLLDSGLKVVAWEG